MSRLLLDTHIWLWYLTGSKDLPRSLRAALDESLDRLWLSPISVWEAGVLVRKGRVRTARAGRDWIKKALDELPLREAPPNFEVAGAVADLSLPHSDPADHFLAATALVYELTLVTVDRHLARSQELSILTA